MDKTVVADIKSNVRDTAAGSIEKHHIARLQSAAANLHTHLRLFRRRSRQADLHGTAENILHKAAAIHTGGRRSAAEAVSHAQQTHGTAD